MKGLTGYRSCAARTLCLVAFLLVALLTGEARADEAKRFPHSQITAAEWQTYFDEVRAKPGAKDVSRPDRPDIVVIDVESEHAIYCFTHGGPAHPAVVVEHIVQTNGGIGLQYDGYFAGSEEVFARWFAGFNARAKAVRQQMQTH